MEQEEVKVPRGGAESFLEVGTAFHNVGWGNNVPYRRNRVPTETNLLGVVTLTYPADVHLKDIDQQEVKVVEEVVAAKIRS